MQKNVYLCNHGKQTPRKAETGRASFTGGIMTVRASLKSGVDGKNTKQRKDERLKSRFSFYLVTIRKIPPLHTHERRRTKPRTRTHYFCFFLQKFTITKLFVCFYYENGE